MHVIYILLNSVARHTMSTHTVIKVANEEIWFMKLKNNK